jgi:hypothetical protein
MELWRLGQGTGSMCTSTRDMHMQVRELVLVGRIGALQPELWRQNQRQEAHVPIFKPCYVHVSTGVGPHGENGDVAPGAVAAETGIGSMPAYIVNPVMYMQVRELVLMGRMGGAVAEAVAVAPGIRSMPAYIVNPVMYMQVRELVLMGRMGALQPELWWRHQG